MPITINGLMVANGSAEGEYIVTNASTSARGLRIVSDDGSSQRVNVEANGTVIVS